MPGGVAPKFGSEKVSRYTGVSQLQLRVSRYTVQLSYELPQAMDFNILVQKNKQCLTYSLCKTLGTPFDSRNMLLGKSESSGRLSRGRQISRLVRTRTAPRFTKLVFCVFPSGRVLGADLLSFCFWGGGLFSLEFPRKADKQGQIW